MRFLEELWDGNIEPTEYDTSSKEYKKLQELICRNEEKLKATMTDEQKELFEKYTDCVREHQTIISMSDEDVIVNMAAELYKLNDINRQKNATYKWALRSFSATLTAIGVICVLLLFSVV